MAQKVEVPSTFNELHSTFVTTEGGTTLTELLNILGSISLTPVLVPLLIPWIVPPSFVQQAVLSDDFYSLVRAILEYPFLIVLPIWIVTIFAGDSDGEDNSSECSAAILIVLSVIPLCILLVNHSVTAPKWLGFKKHWEKVKDLPTGWIKTGKDDGKDSKEIQASVGVTSSKLPFVTNYRAIVIYITILCILAVDFPIFPRRLAKTKTYGISLMDVGTGCFVFANGIVAPEARNRISPLAKSAKATIPIVILGFIRLITVKGIEYQEVVEEYGVHWNFFFTLACVKIISSLLFRHFDSSKSFKVAAVIGILYEGLLKLYDFENRYLLNSDIPRSANLLNANREGVFSVLGYLAIYMASVYFGKIIYWKKRISVRDWTDYAFQSFLQVAILWFCYAASTNLLSLPCRRSANLSYILLMVALNYSLLWFQMFLALALVAVQHLGLIYGPMIFYELNARANKRQERVHVLQNMTKDFSKLQRKKDRDEKRDKEVDECLEKLEDQLEEAVELLKQEQQEGKLQNETLEKIAEIENDIQKLENQMEQSDSDEGVEISARKNLVLLPDLSRAPVILESICFNGLVVFLIGNLLTGLINCSIYTMYTPLYLSLCYLWLYATVIAAFSLTMFWYRIQLKFW